jgi:Tfp pilus assembly protein PilF
LAAYRSASEADPTRNEARQNLGNLLMGLGRTDEALLQFRAINAQRGR